MEIGDVGTEAMDRINAAISIEIQEAVAFGRTDLAVQLAQLKLEINRMFLENAQLPRNASSDTLPRTSSDK